MAVSTRSSTVGSMLVLGGTSDIAEATVRQLGGQGLRTVVLAGRSIDRLTITQAKLRHTGLEEIALVEFDAAATDTHDDALRRIADAHGPFDVVLVAFGDLGDPFSIDLASNVAADLVTTNFNGAVSSSLAAVRMLSNSGGGTLAVISSIAAVRPRVGNLVYGSAKAGLDAFATALADATNRTPVNVMIVRPGFVHSAMTEGLEPAPFAATPEEVAADIAKGLAKGASVVWSPGILRFVAPVLRLLPSKVWRRISER